MILSLLIIGALSAIGSATGKVKFYATHNNQALAKVETVGGIITECYLFADRIVVEHLIRGLRVKPERVSREEFKNIRDLCRPIQEKVIPKRMKEQRESLVERGKALAKMNIMRNQEQKQLNSEKDVKGYKTDIDFNDDQLMAGYDEVQDTGISLGYELLYGIYPGTLWCGAGNIEDQVESEDGLGELKELDACCREHDHCPISIGGFKKEYGLLNYSPITCSDCNCDKKFRKCLKTVNSTESNLLGDVFFNIASIDCIDLNYPWKCVERDFLDLFCLKWERDTSAKKVYEFYDDIGY